MKFQSLQVYLYFCKFKLDQAFDITSQNQTMVIMNIHSHIKQSTLEIGEYNTWQTMTLSREDEIKIGSNILRFKVVNLHLSSQPHSQADCHDN